MADYEREGSDHGPERCRCGRVALVGSDYCGPCLHGANPQPIVQPSPALYALWASDCAEIAERARENGQHESAAKFQVLAEKYSRQARGEAA
jgi:hypothetical protein